MNSLLLDAAPSAQAGSSIWVLLGYFAIIGLALYFLMIRPQRKRQKKEQEMRNNIQIGDEIVTIGGLFGKIVSTKDDAFVIETIDHSKIKILKGSIQTNLTAREKDNVKK